MPAVPAVQSTPVPAITATIDDVLAPPPDCALFLGAPVASLSAWEHN